MTFRPVRSLFLALCVITIAAGVARAAGPDPAVMTFTLPADIKWQESPANPGVRSAILFGDPTKPGELYATINQFQPGFMTQPHFHPNDRYVMVLKGTWYVGSGEKFDPESTTGMPAGSTVKHIANQIHYDGARDVPCEIIIFGIGPGSAKPASEKSSAK